MELICRICRNTHYKKIIPLLKIIPNSNKNKLEIEGEKFEYCFGLKVSDIPNYYGICTMCEQQLNDFYTFKQQAIKSHYELLFNKNAFNNDDEEKKFESYEDADDIENDKNSLILETMSEVTTESNDEILNNSDTQMEELEKIDKTNLILLEMFVEVDDRDFPTENALSLSQDEEEVLSSESFNDNFYVDIDSDDDGLNTKILNPSSENGEFIKISKTLEFNEKIPKSRKDVQTSELISRKLSEQKIILKNTLLKPAEDISQMHCDDEFPKNPSQELKENSQKEAIKFENTQNQRNFLKQIPLELKMEISKKPSQNSSETSEKDNPKKSQAKKERIRKITEVYECDVCARKFYTKQRFEGHMNKHKGLPAYTCNICGKIYKSDRISCYIDHMNDHQGVERRHKCELCPTSYRRKSLFDAHMRTHKNERPFVCETCGNQFYTMSHLKIHLETHADNNNYRCDICHRGFRARATMLKHNKEVHQSKRFNCNVCNKKFSRKEYYQSHIIKNHRNFEDEEYQKNKDPFVCVACGKEFCDYDTLRAHESKTHLRKYFSCEKCGKMFTSNKSYMNHIPNCKLYLEKIGFIDDNKSYECKTCGKQFKRRNFYIDHLQANHSLECDICHKSLSTKNALRTHMQLIHLPKPFSCDECKKEFARENNYKMHIEKYHPDLVDVLFTKAKPNDNSKCS